MESWFVAPQTGNLTKVIKRKKLRFNDIFAFNNQSNDWREQNFVEPNTLKSYKIKKYSNET